MDEARKKKQEDIKRLYKQIKQGCLKDICYNQYCKNNVYGKFLSFLYPFCLAKNELQKF